MAKPLQVLLVEDSERDAALVLRELRRGGFSPEFERVDTPEAMAVALTGRPWDLIISDFTMPRFSAQAALSVMQKAGQDLPFIIVSGTVGEDAAVEAMRAGAQDFMPKGSFHRLIPAIERGLRDAALKSERKAMEQQLLQAMKMEAIGQLTGGIAHDFNNLLGIIVGNTELLLEAAEGQPQVLKLATTVLNTALRGAQLTHRLLAFARRQPLNPQVIDLNEHLPSMIDMLRRTLDPRIHIGTSLGPGLWLTRADPSQVEDALINLAINARDAMPDGGAITIATGNVELGDPRAAPYPGLQAGHYVLLAIADTGVGMAPEVAARATEPFFTTKKQGKGTGLGLSMIYGFARQSGGSLQIRSQPGKGTTVELYLPRATDDAASARASVPADAPPRARGERILLVDDNHELRGIAAEQLAELGYRVQSAEGGPAALALIAGGEPFDLLFTDIGMPDGMSGYELAEAARRRLPRLKVLFTTGHAKAQNNAVAASGPMLRKPYRKRELAAAVRSALES